MTLYAIARRRFPLFLILLCCLAFPAKSFARPITVAVIGDSIATELGRAMQAMFAHSRHVRVIKRTKFSTGLVRTDYFDWNRAAARFLARHRVDRIVVVMGGNDRQSVNVGHRRLERFSRAWRRDYTRRVARFMRILKRAHAKVYWVALPQVASREMTHDYRILNSIYRHEAKHYHFIYVSVWHTFANSKGAYTAYARVGGRRERLRKKDGMHFTDIGSRALARYVAHVMRLR